MHRESAIVQTVLEGVPLPATKQELIDYARSQGARERVLGVLQWIDDREYRLLDDVGEGIARVQPNSAPSSPAIQSDEPPGRSWYTDPHPEPGSIRDEPDVLDYEEQLVREP